MGLAHPHEHTGREDCGLELDGGASAQFKMTSDYPWDGDIDIEVERAAGGQSSPIKLRIPNGPAPSPSR